jgi:uncharacterized membrane protein YfcA
MMQWLLPLLLGFGAGVLSAWGVGGGTLLLLFMTLFLDVEQKTAQGINLLFFLPTAAASLIAQRKSGYVDRAALPRLIPFAMLSALAAALFAAKVDVTFLRPAFGIFLLFAALSMVLRKE